MQKIVLGFLFIAISNFCQGQDNSDLANFGRYEKENAIVSKLSPPNRKVVFMGNSITDNWVRYDSAFFDDNGYIDRGISGQTSSQMLLRFRKDVIDLHPKVVVILAGTNDIAGNTGYISLENILGNIISMAELAKTHHIKVILCSVLPAFDYPWRKGKEPNIKIPQLNTLIKNYADQNKISYADYFLPMNDGKNGLKSELTKDGVHPILDGYKIMETVIQKKLAILLK